MPIELIRSIIKDLCVLWPLNVQDVVVAESCAIRLKGLGKLILTPDDRNPSCSFIYSMSKLR
jgi:hypothetical protein